MKRKTTEEQEPAVAKYRFAWGQNDLFNPYDQEALRRALIAALADALVARYQREEQTE